MFTEITINHLWIVLVILAVLRIATGLYGKKWLKLPLDEGAEVESYSRERTNNLTMAGFALAAIALFLTLGFSQNENRAIEVVDTVAYLSISLVTFIIAAYLYNLATKRVFGFLAGTLEWIGLMSIGLALLIFFQNTFPNDLRFIFIYAIFFFLVYVLASMELSLWSKYFKSLKNSKSGEEND